MENTILSWLVPILLTTLTALAGFASKFIQHLIDESKSSKNANVVATGLNLVGAAVRMVEEKYGPDKDPRKRAEAVQFLVDHVHGMTAELAGGIVDGLYASAKASLAPLASGPAQK